MKIPGNACPYFNAESGRPSILGYNKQMVLVGLTGNYGMGKSSVLGLFQRFGAATISCDEIVSRLLDEKQVALSISAMFGSGVLNKDGKVNRKAAACLVFKDPDSRKGLEGLLHPLVFKEVERFAARPDFGDRVVVVEVPLLFESSAEARFDKTVVVHTSEDKAVERLMQKGVSPEDARARLQAQMPVTEKLRRADYAVDNGGTPEETEKQVSGLYRLLVSLIHIS